MHDGGNYKGEGNRICPLSERWGNIFLAEMAINDRDETVKHEYGGCETDGEKEGVLPDPLYTGKARVSSLRKN